MENKISECLSLLSDKQQRLTASEENEAELNNQIDSLKNLLSANDENSEKVQQELKIRIQELE